MYIIHLKRLQLADTDDSAQKSIFPQRHDPVDFAILLRSIAILLHMLSSTSIIPARLSIGDTIGIVTPSAAVDASPSANPRQEFQEGLDYLKQLGFQVLLGKHALKRGAFGAGTPRERAEDINEMFANPEVQAIISSHGGVFANSCLPHLDYELMRRRPKILMGFSDISTLQLAIYARCGLVTFHGNMVMYYFGMAPQAYDRQEFLDRLVEGRIGPVSKNSEWCTLRGTGTAEGPLLGGNDWVMQWLLGTPYWPDFDGAILFMEVPGFDPEIFYNRLHQFKQAGLFDRINGMLLGYALGKDGIRPENLVLEITANYSFPIVRTDDFGHHAPNTVLPVGSRAHLDANSATLHLIEPCVR